MDGGKTIIGGMQLKRKALHREEGMATLEALILLTLTLIIMLFFLGFGFLFYQRWVVVQVANDTATRIAHNYAYPASDAVTGYMDSATRAVLSPYRYFNSTYEGMRQINADKAVSYAKWTLKMSSLAYLEGEPDIDVKVEHDGFAIRHVSVTIDARYRVLFSGALNYWGMGGTQNFHYTGYAQIVDLSDYINSVGTVKDLSDFSTGDTFTKLWETAGTLIQDIQKAYQTAHPWKSSSGYSSSGGGKADGAHSSGGGSNNGDTYSGGGIR